VIIIWCQKTFLIYVSSLNLNLDCHNVDIIGGIKCVTLNSIINMPDIKFRWPNNPTWLLYDIQENYRYFFFIFFRRKVIEMSMLMPTDTWEINKSHFVAYYIEYFNFLCVTEESNWRKKNDWRPWVDLRSKWGEDENYGKYYVQFRVKLLCFHECIFTDFLLFPVI
jgi:hypothetical protein